MALEKILRAVLGDQPQFTFRATGVGELRVVRFFGSEGISGLFEFHLELAGPEVSLASLIDKPALLKIEGLDTARHVHGHIAEVEYTGQTRDYSLCEVTLVPWIWRLQHRQSCRIFQDQTTPQILQRILRDAGLAQDWVRFELTAEYAPRNYCVQYGETDLAFISRLMEEDGIFYFFEHMAERHVLVLADHPGAHRPIPGAPSVWFMPPSGAMVVDREHVQHLRFGERIRSGTVKLRDLNLHQTDLAMEVNESGKQNPDLEIYDYPGGYQDPGAGGPHQGRTLAKMRLEGQQAARRWGAGKSDCPRLTAGFTFTLIGHPRYELDGDYRVVQVSHVGNQPQALDNAASGDSSYTNEFGVTEMKQPFRPPQQTRRPAMRGLQSATVVGPAAEEVFPDEHGRVKVKFHWDRAESFDETSSCWVRVSQLWAGNGWGAMFLPRVGHEVLIDFLEGDPDRPVVVGRLYTGNNKTPYPLPQHSTRSTIKSESAPGGGGHNELRFEDLKGSEEVYIHAQRDLNEIVLNNNSRTVTANQTFSVGANQSFTITKNRTVTVTEGDEALHVDKGKSTTSVKMDRTVKVETGDSSLTVETGKHTVTAKQDVSHTSQTASVTVTAHTSMNLAAQTSTLSASAQQAVSLNSEQSTLTMSGMRKVSVNSRTALLDLFGALATRVHSGAVVQIKAPNGVSVRGGTRVGVKAGKITITADTEIKLKVGASTITISASGIVISAPKINSTSDSVNEISGALIKLN